MGGLMRGDRYKRTELKDAISESHLFYNRATVAFLLVFIGLIILVSRAFILQVVNHKNYSTLSDRNRISLIAEAPVRGIIYDRNGVILADNRSVYSLVLVPEKVKNMNATLMGLKALFHIDKDLIDDFRQRLRSTRRFTQKVLLNNISEVQRARFAVNKYRFPGVSIESRLVRYYPFAEKMVHFLGYVGRINDREIENLDAKNYRATLDIGKLGLEKFYEQKLHGLVGRREVETDAVGREIRTLDRTPPIPGDSLYLSIDSRLQLKAVEAMDGIKGALVAVDPETGKVLALVSNPSYDPNDFVLGIGVSAYKKLLESEDRPLFNRALRGQYPPGSTIKPMLALTALEQGVITEDYQLSDPGWYQLENDDHKYRDHKKYGHGMVNLYQAIVHSCDTYFYDVGYKLGIDRI
ncbi:MAG: penicillin-binding protein 2, partial [Gammaproteobacteria bacterium CG22_combo_CG10-13_8_21_14_all_40_8]